MSFSITAQDLIKIDDLTGKIKKDSGVSYAEYYTPLINSVLKKYNINTYLRASHFISQILHESGHLIYNEEIASGEKYEGRKDLGNTQSGDGKKFKGRGLIQLTGRSNYAKYRDTITEDIISNPKLVSTKYSADAAGWYWDTRNLNKYADEDDGVKITKKINGGTNGLSSRMDLLESAKSVLKKYDSIQTQNQDQDSISQNPTNNTVIESQEVDDNNRSQDDIQNNNLSSISKLTEIVSSTISPIKVEVDMDSFSRSDKRKIEKGLANIPYVWYNGYQISYSDIRKFNLFHSGILPSINLTFFDTLGLLKNDGFPVDDTIISIYLSSRHTKLRSIRMDFKIINFNDRGEGLYDITGICNIPDIFIRRFSSYGQKTSFEALMQICKEIGIGFYSNVNNTDDKMTWINPGIKVQQFIENIIQNSYISDNSFIHGYVDYYYNLCFVDIAKEMNRDVSNDKMIESNGISSLDLKPEEDQIIPLILQNDPGMRDSSTYFEKYQIFNKSTKISLEKAYLNRTKFYDTNNKDILVFDVDSITSDGSKSIIMKSKPNDEKFFKENMTSIWIGKQDSSNDNSGNVHKNYSYSVVQNRQNLDDITKISCILDLPNPNYNVYKYQKVEIAFISQKPTPTHDSIFFKRLSGEWIINNIEYSFVDLRMMQNIVLLKRELSLSPDEINDSSSRPKYKQNDQNDNEISNNDLIPTGDSVQLPASLKDSESISGTKEGELQLNDGGDLYKKSNGKVYVADISNGIAGKFLRQFQSDLEVYISKNYPDSEISIVSNGITRSLDQIVGNTNPKRSKTSKHGAGLAMDYKINTSKVKYTGLDSNSKLVKDVKLMSLINNYVSNGPYKDMISWGGNFTGGRFTKSVVPGVGEICVDELHHFEIKDSKMPLYWEPYKGKLQSLGLSVPSKQSDLSDVYKKGLNS